MSKYTDDLEDQLKDVKKIKEVTKDMIKDGSKLAMEEIHDASSLEKLKKELRK